jgi:signal transduction histidine kinase
VNRQRLIGNAEPSSELGRLATVLNSTFAQLDVAFAQQARFTSDAAHELRTPVSVILAQTQSTLARDRHLAEYRETLEACQRAARRMHRLIESLLELARLDAGQESLRREPCDLAKIAADCVDQIRPLTTEKNVQIRSDLAPTPYDGDVDRLTQVVTNLLSNSVAYNHQDGEICVPTQLKNDTAVLSVTNTGPGILRDDLPHISERFHRADKARTGSHSGLGLAIVQTFVKAHGGTVEATSEVGHGATFTVKLPWPGGS